MEIISSQYQAFYHSSNTDLLNQLKIDFQLCDVVFPDYLTECVVNQEWIKTFKTYLETINKSSRSKLIQLLYRMDIDEEELSDTTDFGDLAVKIVQQEREKIDFRNKNNYFF